MKVIVAGSRGITDYSLVVQAINNSNFQIDEIISGGAKGVDKLGERYATEYNIKLTIFPADWSKGRSAGFQRNVQMAKYADALIALWDGSSKGTAHMINIAKSHKLYVYVE